MVNSKKELTKEEWEQYTEVTKSGIRIVSNELKVFGESLCMGYGIYGTRCYEEDGRYFVDYSRGETCD